MQVMTRRAAISGHGAQLALAAAALSGAGTPLAKLLLGEVAPWLLAGLLYFGSGIGLAAIVGLRALAGGAATEAPLRHADLPWLAAAVTAGGVIAPVLLLAGLAHTIAPTPARLTLRTT